jgi:hypothetical protein
MHMIANVKPENAGGTLDIGFPRGPRSAELARVAGKSHAIQEVLVVLREDQGHEHSQPQSSAPSQDRHERSRIWVSPATSTAFSSRSSVPSRQGRMLARAPRVSGPREALSQRGVVRQLDGADQHQVGRRHFPWNDLTRSWRMRVGWRGRATKKFFSCTIAPTHRGRWRSEQLLVRTCSSRRAAASAPVSKQGSICVTSASGPACARSTRGLDDRYAKPWPRRPSCLALEG